MLELNKIHNENCLDTMARMDDGFIDLTVTSPPYDNLRNYNGYEFDFESIAKELFRVTKSGGVLVWVVADGTKDGTESGTSFSQALFFKEIGFKLHDTMIFYCPKPPLTHNRYEQEFEYMFILSKGKPNTFNPLTEKKLHIDRRQVKAVRRESDGSVDVGYAKQTATKIKGNVWKINTGGGISSADPIAFNHPAIFPEQLAKDHILSWSNENDLIYDPFMGSGTTAKAAHLLKRKWIGSEISAEYVELANKRIEPYLMQETLF
jgi:DNA modification methylase